MIAACVMTLEVNIHKSIHPIYESSSHSHHHHHIQNHAACVIPHANASHIDTYSIYGHHHNDHDQNHLIHDNQNIDDHQKARDNAAKIVPAAAHIESPR